MVLKHQINLIIYGIKSKEFVLSRVSLPHEYTSEYVEYYPLDGRTPAHISSNNRWILNEEI